MVLALSQRYTLSVGDVELVGIDYTDHLDSSETLTGTPTATEITTTDLTISNGGFNSAARTILGRSVAANCAVQFKVSGQLSGVTYTIRVSTQTNATVPRTIVRDIYLTGG